MLCNFFKMIFTLVVMVLAGQTFAARRAGGIVSAVVQFFDFPDLMDVLVVVVLDVFYVDELVAEGERDGTHGAACR